MKFGKYYLACCSPWGRKESDATEWSNNFKKKNKQKKKKTFSIFFYLKSETSEAYYGVPKLKFQK